MAVKKYTTPKKMLDVIRSKSIIDGVLISDISVSTSPTIVNHGLGRKYLGYILIKSNNNISLKEESDLPTKFLELTATDSAIISLWVF